MARILSQSPHLETLSLTRSHAPRLLLAVRRRSGGPERSAVVGQAVEVDHEEDAAVSSASGLDARGVQLFEDAIHWHIVRQAAPYWLPFRPGSSYWVPSKKFLRLGLAEGVANPMTTEECLSFSSVRGWPSLTYFVEGIPPRHVWKSVKQVPVQSDDEEG